MDDRAELPANFPTAQSFVFTVLGRYRLQDNSPLSTATYIEVLSRAGISQNAARLILARMMERGFLQRSRQGRTAYWAATDLALTLVRSQVERTFPKAPAIDGEVWTILSFSMPESHRKARDLLRKRLEWDGFGILRDGVWIAAGDRDLSGVLDPQALDEVGKFVEVFTANPKLVDIRSMVARAWDLDALQRNYALFLRDWDVPNPAPMTSDALGRILLLVSNWRKLIRETSRLPQTYLPDDGLAARSSQVFSAHYDADTAIADKIFASILATSNVFVAGR